MSQLKANGFNVAVAHTGTGTSSDSTPSGATGAADKKIVGDETLTFEAGNGINVSQNGGKITITNTGSGAGGSGNTHITAFNLLKRPQAATTTTMARLATTQWQWVHC